jgi:hypothetical protein
MAAQICSTLVNCHRGKASKPAKATDFMKYKRVKSGKQAKQRQTMEEQMALAKQITLAYGGVVLDKKKSKG